MAGQVVDTAKYKYPRIKVRGPDGKARYTASNCDAIAKSLFGMDRAALEEVANSNHQERLVPQFAVRNLGHARMILGQALRHAIAAGDKSIRIRGINVLALDQEVPWPKGYFEELKGTHQHPVRKGQPSKYRTPD